MGAVNELAPVVGMANACFALRVPRSTIHRNDARRLPTMPPEKPSPRFAPPLALSDAERLTLREVLCSERFADCAPPNVYATLLDEGIYLGSVRTMYRLLAVGGQARERRNQLTHPVYAKPELLATGPNKVWSWDITKLKGNAKCANQPDCRNTSQRCHPSRMPLFLPGMRGPIQPRKSSSGIVNVVPIFNPYTLSSPVIHRTM